MGYSLIAQPGATKADLAAVTPQQPGGLIVGGQGELPPGPRSTTLRSTGGGAAYTPDLTLNLAAFGARFNDYSASAAAQNDAAIAAAIAAAKSLGDAGLNANGGEVALTYQGRLVIGNPIVLPRTGATPNFVVTLVGGGTRHSVLQAYATFPTGRGMIEWEATASRAWHQRIANMSFSLPFVANTCAIWHKKIGVGTTTTDFSNEWLQLDLDNLLIEGSNQYHQRLIMLETGNRYATIRNVFGDPTPGSVATYDTYLIETASQRGGADPLVGEDSLGLGYCLLTNVHPMLRRGGNCGLLKGRIYHTVIEGAFSNGGRAAPDLDLTNSHLSLIRKTGCEGQGEQPQWRFTRCQSLDLQNIGIGTPDAPAAYGTWAATTAYAVGALVVSPSLRSGTATTKKYFQCTVAGTSGGTEPAWSSLTNGQTVADGGATWQAIGDAVGNGMELWDSHFLRVRSRGVAGGGAPFSTRLGKALYLDALSSDNVFQDFNLVEAAPGTAANEIQIDAPAANRNQVSGVGLYGSASSPTLTPFLIGWHPHYDVPRAPKAVAVDYTLTLSDDLVMVDATTAGRTITLPLVAGAQGKRLTVKKSDSSANAVTVTRSGSDTIEGATSKSLTARWSSITVESDGIRWVILATTGAVS